MWNAYLQAMSGYISGAGLERLSIADYLAYDAASTGHNWRVPAGYGTLIAASLPPAVALRLATPVEAINLEAADVSIVTRAGTITARTAILTVSTAVLAGGTIRLPAALDDWCHAAANLPLGRNEKLFLEIVGDSPFEPETHVIGDPRDPRTGSYYIRPFGRPVIEGFFGGEGAEVLAEHGPAAGFAYAIDQLAALFGSDVRRSLRPAGCLELEPDGDMGEATAMPFRERRRRGTPWPARSTRGCSSPARRPTARLLDRPWRLSERGTRSRRSAVGAQAAPGP